MCCYIQANAWKAVRRQINQLARGPGSAIIFNATELREQIGANRVKIMTEMMLDWSDRGELACMLHN